VDRMPERAAVWPPLVIRERVGGFVEPPIHRRVVGRHRADKSGSDHCHSSVGSVIRRGSRSYCESRYLVSNAIVWEQGGIRTSDDQPAVSANCELATKIVAAYVRRSQIGADQIGALISNVHQALADLGKPGQQAAGPRTPAVPIKQSVRLDYVVYLECRRRGQTLRRHITVAQVRPRAANRPEEIIRTAAYREDHCKSLARTELSWVLKSSARRGEPARVLGSVLK